MVAHDLVERPYSLVPMRRKVMLVTAIMPVTYTPLAHAAPLRKPKRWHQRMNARQHNCRPAGIRRDGYRSASANAAGHIVTGQSGSDIKPS